MTGGAAVLPEAEEGEEEVTLHSEEGAEALPEEATEAEAVEALVTIMVETTLLWARENQTLRLDPVI